MSVEQAIVILGCRVEPGGEVRGALKRRVARGATLYHDRRLELVVVSGGKHWYGSSEAQAMRSELQRLGVPSQVILEEAESFSTRENAAFSALLLAERAVSHVHLVTCDFHMRRAASLFRERGLQVDEYPARSPISPAARAQRAMSELLKAALDRYAPWGIGSRYPR